MAAELSRSEASEAIERLGAIHPGVQLNNTFFMFVSWYDNEAACAGSSIDQGIEPLLADIRRVPVADIPRAIVATMALLNSDRAVVRERTLETVECLLGRLPSTGLTSLDVLARYRGETRTYAWSGEVSLQESAWAICALLTMNASGYLRESAMRRLVELRPPEVWLPFILLRLNDWVPQVRTLADQMVRSQLTQLSPEHWWTLVGLFSRLQHRTRVDQRWFTDGVQEKLRRPESRAALLEAARSLDPMIARMAIAAGLSLPEDAQLNVVKVGLEHPDSVVRLRVAQHVRRTVSLPGRFDALSRLATDSFMPIRREVLYALLEEPEPTRSDGLRARLLDPHSSMRHAARVYLRQDEHGKSTGFDAAAFYRARFGTSRGAELRSVISGLGETGEKADVGLLMPYVHGEDDRTARAAVRAVGLLDTPTHAGWLTRLLADLRLGVAKEASRALRRQAKTAPLEEVESVFRSSPIHARRFALSVLLELHLLDALPYALEAAGDPEELIRARGLVYLKQISRWTSVLGPTVPQQVRMCAAFARWGGQLPQRLRDGVTDFLRPLLPSD